MKHVETGTLKRTFRPNTRTARVGFRTRYITCMKCEDKGCSYCTCPDCDDGWLPNIRSKATGELIKVRCHCDGAGRGRKEE